jgi:OOP family OmpA-OmpF porin
MQVRIEGHTDSRGSRAYNLRLSQSRADSVRAYLIGKGISSDRLEAKGYGPDQPIDNNKTAAGRERNRRVEFMITKQ